MDEWCADDLDAAVYWLMDVGVLGIDDDQYLYEDEVVALVEGHYVGGWPRFVAAFEAGEMDE